MINFSRTNTTRCIRFQMLRAVNERKFKFYQLKGQLRLTLLSFSLLEDKIAGNDSQVQIRILEMSTSIYLATHHLSVPDANAEKHLFIFILSCSWHQLGKGAGVGLALLATLGSNLDAIWSVDGIVGLI